jgi:disulfide oxidoreductase YuzD
MQVPGQFHAVAALRPEKKLPPHTPWTGRYLDFRNDLDVSEKGEISDPYQESKYMFPVVQLVLFSK